MTNERGSNEGLRELVAKWPHDTVPIAAPDLGAAFYRHVCSKDCRRCAVEAALAQVGEGPALAPRITGQQIWDAYKRVDFDELGPSVGWDRIAQIVNGAPVPAGRPAEGKLTICIRCLKSKKCLLIPVVVSDDEYLCAQCISEMLGEAEALLEQARAKLDERPALSEEQVRSFFWQHNIVVWQKPASWRCHCSRWALDSKLNDEEIMRKSWAEHCMEEFALLTRRAETPAHWPNAVCFTCEGESGLPPSKTVDICERCYGDDGEPTPAGGSTFVAGDYLRKGTVAAPPAIAEPAGDVERATKHIKGITGKRV